MFSCVKNAMSLCVAPKCQGTVVWQMGKGAQDAATEIRALFVELLRHEHAEPTIEDTEADMRCELRVLAKPLATRPLIASTIL